MLDKSKRIKLRWIKISTELTKGELLKVKYLFSKLEHLKLLCNLNTLWISTPRELINNTIFEVYCILLNNQEIFKKVQVEIKHSYKYEDLIEKNAAK